MENCVVTKLNGSVTGNLPVFGSIRFSNEAGDGTLSGKISIQGEGCTVKVSGGTFTVGSDTTPRTSYTIPNGNQSNFMLSNNNIQGSISNKNDIEILAVGTAGSPSAPTNIKFETEDLDGLSDLFTLNWFGGKIDGNIDLGNTLIKNILMWDCSLGGFVNIPSSLETIDVRRCHLNIELADLASLTGITKVVMSSATVSGNIESLGALKMCTQFFLDHTDVEGELADLITALGTNRPAGAPSSVVFQLVETQCTYNGSAITESITINF